MHSARSICMIRLKCHYRYLYRGLGQIYHTSCNNSKISLLFIAWVHPEEVSTETTKRTHRKPASSFSCLWSWRGLNPRPNEEIIRFLHAYLCLWFSCTNKTRATNPYLSLFISFFTRDKRRTIPDFAVPPDQTLRNKSFWATSRHRHCACDKVNLLYFD